MQIISMRKIASNRLCFCHAGEQTVALVILHITQSSLNIGSLRKHSPQEIFSSRSSNVPDVGFSFHVYRCFAESDSSINCNILFSDEPLWRNCSGPELQDKQESCLPIKLVQHGQALCGYSTQLHSPKRTPTRLFNLCIFDEL